MSMSGHQELTAGAGHGQPVQCFLLGQFYCYHIKFTIGWTLRPRWDRFIFVFGHFILSPLYCCTINRQWYRHCSGLYLQVCQNRPIFKITFSSTYEDRAERKAQHLEGFEPTIPGSWGVDFTTVLQSLPNGHRDQAGMSKKDISFDIYHAIVLDCEPCNGK